MSEAEKIIQAFPSYLKEIVLSLVGKVDLQGDIHSKEFDVILNNERLTIPSRIYFEEPKEWRLWRLNKTELLILNCLFTRHHNGFIRQKRLKEILLSDEYWVIPFVMQLLGEYVQEILVTIEDNLSEKLGENFNRFINENPKYFETTKSRIISYWDCYYRTSFPKKRKLCWFSDSKQNYTIKCFINAGI
jgi:hypothetical protein